MQLKVFKSKIHRATVTKADLHYEGSITIDKTLLETANLYQYEAVWVWNINNGERLMTYIIEGEADSGVICLNGSAARLCQPGDLVIITAFVDITPEALETFKPTVVLVDDKNNVKRVLHSSGHELNPLKVSIEIDENHVTKTFGIAKELKKKGIIIDDIQLNKIFARIDDTALIDDVKNMKEITNVSKLNE